MIDVDSGGHDSYLSNTILVKIVSFKDHPVATRGRSADSR